MSFRRIRFQVESGAPFLRWTRLFGLRCGSPAKWRVGENELRLKLTQTLIR